MIMRILLRIGGWSLLVITLLVLAIVACAYFMMRASLPTLEGEIKSAGVRATVTATRDKQGTVSISAKDPLDAIRVLGFVHAQERFFEMDLARRSAAGELSALLGEATINVDKEKRRHRLRARMTAKWQQISAEDREWTSAYTQGVNAGLTALAVRPWQYFVLRTEPEPWREVDSLLVIGEMYYMLQSGGFDARLRDILLRQQIGDPLFDWLQPAGGTWDAALDGSVIAASPLPPPTLLNVRKDSAPVQNAAVTPVPPFTDIAVGSNNWAVGGAITSHGGAILADDMHLGIGVPNIWFRAQLTIGEGASARRIVGATLPGGPAMVVGSNGNVAWGFTNGYGQWFDWVAIAPGSEMAAGVKTIRETIAVKGAPPIELDVREAPFGPILRTIGATDYALAWTLYREGAVNAHATRMMFATTIDEAILIAQQSGIPHQNVMFADKVGNVAWTIMGRIPVYPSGPDAGSRNMRGLLTAPDRLPTEWLAPDKYPLIKNPADARLWTANSRQVGGEGGNIIGDGGFDLGARAGQIRDRLREQKSFDEKKLYAIQLDNESRFLKRWSELALATAVAKPNEKTSAVAKELKAWNGRADIDQTGHRIARAFRQQVLDQLWKSWLTATPGATGRANNAAGNPDGRFEYAAWSALSMKPEHLLPQPFASWDNFLAAQLASVHDDLIKQEGTLAQATWGKRNAANFRHPFARAMPFLSGWLNMPKSPQAGDNHMPMVASPTFGASQRMVVSPGHEDQAIFVMPSGQSGHPLSPFYGAGHGDWLGGKAGSLLAGETAHTLRFVP